MKIILTGSSGFVGSNYIAKNLVHEIIRVKLSENSLPDYDFTGYDAVIHLAALVHQMDGAPREKYFEINSDLTYETALKSKNQGVKHFVFLSTVKVFGESTTGMDPFSETSNCNPIDPYGESKLDAEKRIMGLIDDNFAVSIIRPPLVYGAGVKANMFNLIKLIDKVPVLPFGKIHNKRSFVYIDNLIALIDAVLLKQNSGVFIASDPDSFSTTDLIDTIALGLNKNLLNIKMPFLGKLFLKTVFPSQYDRLWGSLEVDPHNGWKELNFSPPVSTQNGILEMVKWYSSSRDS